jgi:23S rRNA U2552 (ribose-2'-O)-methylase RlmE/FtsJ
MDLTGLANLTLKEKCSTQDYSIQSIISDHLAARCKVYRDLVEVRAKVTTYSLLQCHFVQKYNMFFQGWANKDGDRHFKQQRETADQANSTNSGQYFFEMMQHIGDEMQASTGALYISSEKPCIMDLCMAPGGYTASAIKLNPNATVFGVTLPKALGGHPVLLKPRHEIKVIFTDITMEAAELGVRDLPEEHPDLALFKKQRLLPEEAIFDLSFCDGQVLRTHAEHRHADREAHEAKRLTLAQLVIATQHIRPGGTMIILLHRVDHWSTLKLLQSFDKFSRVQLFKPKTAHASRGSFYLIAQNISPYHAHALAARDSWLQGWKDATFDRKNQVKPSEQEVLDVLITFGERLIELAEPIWAIQKHGIENSKWFKNETVGSKAVYAGTASLKARQGLQRGALRKPEIV